MIPVSVIIVTRNEEQRLESCLAVLKDFDDIWVVDSNSTDHTVQIAEKYGARIVPFTWNGQYPKKRQWCLDHLNIRYDFVFFLDADEILTPGLITEIAHSLLDRAGYFISGMYLWDGRFLRHGLRNHKLCLFNRHKMIFPVIDDLDIAGMGEIEGHYQPVFKDADETSRIGRFQTPLIHHAAACPEQWDERHRRYARWEGGMNRKRAWPKDPIPVRQWLKTIFRSMPLRGEIYFFYAYLWKGGFLDGRAGLDFARKRAAYYRMIEQGERLH